MVKLTAEQRVKLDTLIGTYEAARIALANEIEDIAAEWANAHDDAQKRIEMLRSFGANVEGAGHSPLNLWLLSN